MEIESRSASKMSYESQIISKDFLKATLGDENGEAEYNRRCDLVSIGVEYEPSVMQELVSKLRDDGQLTDSEEELIDRSREITLEDGKEAVTADVQLVLDVQWMLIQKQLDNFI